MNAEADRHRPSWYRARYPDAKATTQGVLAHHVEVGDAAGHWPHPLFDPDFYSEQHRELAQESGARLRHYVEVGEKQGSWPAGLFDPLFYLRRERELRLTGVAQSEESIKKQELRAVHRADGAIAVSEFDRGKLLEKVPNAQIHVVSLIHEAHPQETPFSDRNGILFIGGFQHGPNTDAVLWFLTDIFPIVRSWIPDLRFHIIGTNPPDEIRDRACDHIIVEGFVEDVEEQFASRRLSIAPLRYGSGVKGKINQSMAYGLPCVATPAAAEGMDLKWGSEIMVAETAHEFAEAVAKLYENQELWTMLARNSVASIERSYSAAVAEEGLGKILKHHGRHLPKSRT